MAKLLNESPLPIGLIFRQLRQAEGLPLRKVAAKLDIDQAILSKIERGKRKATKSQVRAIAKIFNVSERKLLIQFFSDIIIYEIAKESFAIEILKVAEHKIQYMVKKAKE